MNESSIQVLAIIASNLIIMLTFFGVSVSLHNSLREDVKAIHDEMKDFHGRLERQDAEFKGRMEKQDAEFKSHLIYYHDKNKIKG